MTATFSVDLISDLNLDSGQDFDWEGKPTSLFCVIAGGISDDLDVIKNSLDHLSSYYRGIMYIDGSREHPDVSDYETRIEQLRQICQPMNNVVYMHNHVVILNSVAFVACNGWFHNNPHINQVNDLIKVENLRYEDVGYLTKTIKTLQLHGEARKIVVITSSVPSESLLYNPAIQQTDLEPGLALMMDTENKADVWMYGGTNIQADTQSTTVRFVNNPFVPGQPYWPKRVLV